ncbi:hypothetical protein DPMN_116678 [Dreissena polymorpha]|uniref:Uncharacterized protein n=1 Tax=Dreissena polymorpha TaxID=45954 RepID=A0A9D4KP83_DREPO|nr:hypothetical protein DPMN_116678 [Dreissena polymorpha]
MARQRPTLKDNFGWGPYIVEIDFIVIRDVQYQFEVNQCRNEEIIVKGNFGWAWPMWAGRPRIDCFVIREVQYQFEVNRCRNEDIIVKGNFGWEWPMWAGAPGLVMGPCIDEINCIVIREVQYQFEENRCRNEETRQGLFVWPIIGGAPQVEIDRIVIREAQYQLEENRCRNEEIIVKDNFGWIERIVIKEVQYQFEVNRCRNEEIIVKDNFGWVWPMWAAEIDRIVIREVQYQFEVNWCRNEEIIVKGNYGWAWPLWPGRPRVGYGAIHKAQYQFEVNQCRNEEVNFQGSGANRRTDGWTDAHQYNIPTFSLKNHCLKVGSHCRSDQLDHPDHQNFPTKPDQARLKRVYTTSSRPIVDNTLPPHDSFTTSTQPSFRFLLDHLNLYASPIRSQLNQVDLSSIATRSSLDQIVMVVLQSYKLVNGRLLKL